MSQKRTSASLLKLFLPSLAVICSAVPYAHADSNADLQKLQQQLNELQKHFAEMQEKQNAEIDSLKKQLAEKLQQAGNNPSPVTDSLPQSVASSGQTRNASYMNLSFNSIMTAGYSTESKPSEQLQLGDHDPQKRGFNLRNAEIALDGAVDPYLKGFANIVLKLEEDESTEIELEESYLQTTSLPANLQVKAGQFFANFGRQNSQHPHQWHFVDQPVVLTRVFGPDGLRNLGVQTTWLVPTSFYSELSLGLFNSNGETGFQFRNPGEDDGTGISRVHGRTASEAKFRGIGDLLSVPRITSSIDLTDTQTLVLGLSGAFGPNSSGKGLRTQIYGADTYWKWKPENASAGFPFVAIQSEALLSRYEAGADEESSLPLTEETLKDYGLYSQIVWGFTEGWVVGLRGEYADGNSGQFDAEDAFRGERTRLSPVLTYYPSEFSKVRLQYNFDSDEKLRDASSLWVQLEFNLGSHGAHKF